MKKIFISILILIALIASFLLLSHYAFHDYPMTTIVTSENVSEDNKFYLNNKVAGDNNGFCVIIRDEKHTEVKLVNNSKQEIIVIENKFRFNILESSGANLGLIAKNANQDENLRKLFNCKDEYKK